MKATLTSTILGAFLAAHNAHASDTGQQLGVAGVALAGAAAGGPVGLIVGATLASHYVKQSTTRADALQRASRLDAELDAARAELTTEQRTAAQLAHELAQLQRENARLAEDRALLGELQFDIHFRTADSAPGETDKLRLVRLAGFLRRHPELRVELHGYADVRGSDASNDRLALARANAVAAVLAGQDIDSARILAFAHGERQALAGDSDTDGLAYDRRVRVALGTGKSAATQSAGVTEPVGADDLKVPGAAAGLHLQLSGRTGSHAVPAADSVAAAGGAAD